MKKNLHFLLMFRSSLLLTFIFVSLNVFSQNPVLLSSPIPGGTGKSIQKIVSISAGETFFNTIDNNNHFSNLWGLWTTDGTPRGTKKITLTSPPVPGGSNSFISTEATLLTPLGNSKILFGGDDEQGYGEIWVSDGTQAGTFVLEQFIPGSPGAPVSNITSLGNIGIYSVITNDGKLQLHKTDGTYAGTEMVYDFGLYTDYNVSYFKPIGNVVYFELNNPTASPNNFIWRTDGTTAGTYQVKDLGQDYGFASDFMSFGTNIYFITISSTFGDYIWKSDGTNAGTSPLKQISTAFNQDNLFPSYAAIPTALCFTANDGINGKELWKTDGTVAGTGIAGETIAGSGSSNPTSLVSLNGAIYYAANTLFGVEPVLFNGTNVAVLKDIFPGATGSNPSNFTIQNNTILFSAARNTSDANELWITDGGTANTFEIANVNTNTNESSSPSLISVSGNAAYFAANIDINYDGITDPCIYKYTAPQETWTGNVSNNASDPNNWFPAITPGSADNIVIAAGETNALGNNPFFFCNDLYNNGTINVDNGLILINGNFFNSGTVNNTLPGVFGVVSGSNSSLRMIGSSGTFNGQLTLSAGVNARLTSFSYFPQLRIEGADTIYLGTYSLQIDNFTLQTPKIVTDSVGQLAMPVNISPVIFPVMADANSYTPVTIVNHDGIPGRYFYVKVNNGVYSNGTSGNLVTQQAVNKTWDVIESNIQPSNADITLQWNASDELTGFDRNNVYLNHYASGAWDTGTPGIASGSNPYTFTRTGFTSFSPFSITSSATILPVTLVSFTANKINNAVQLNWQTTSEKNISFYNIERSKDGNVFENIEQLKASRNTLSSNKYSYIDQQPFAGTNFYRLKMIDADGKFNYSRVVAIKMDSKNITLQIFPNPARNIVNIQVNGYNENALLQITDITGKKVKEEKVTLNGNTSVSIDINNFSKGTYSLLLKGNSINQQKKFVKE